MDAGQQNTDKLTYSVREGAQALGISKNSMYSAIRNGEINFIKVGKRILIPKCSIDSLLHSAGKKDN
jgi:excisionase family DNA binding protein